VPFTGCQPQGQNQQLLCQELCPKTIGFIDELQPILPKKTTCQIPPAGNRTIRCFQGDQDLSNSCPKSGKKNTKNADSNPVQGAKKAQIIPGFLVSAFLAVRAA